MQNRIPTLRPVLAFTPVRRKHRVDGWTPDREHAFIAALVESGSVEPAAYRINMSPEGAYYLRRQPGAESFRRAWDAAIDHGVQALRDIALERAHDGIVQPIMFGGKVVGEKRVYNDRLLMFLIRRSDQLDALMPGTKGSQQLAHEIKEAAEARVPELWAKKQAEEQEATDAVRADSPSSSN